MNTTAQKNLARAEAYYTAIINKDTAAVAAHFHPNIQFVSPMVTLAGKDAALEAAKRYMALVKKINIRARLASDEQVMLTYEADFGEPIGACRTAVVMAFKDDLIGQLEVFFDARPFEKNLR